MAIIKLGKDLEAYSSPTAIVLPGEVDEREMSAGFVICSVAVDREDEIVLPQGCRATLDNYRANPIVLWDHNHDGTFPPIGLSEDRDKRFTLRIFDNDRITARCHFHGKAFRNENLSYDVFRLVAEGAVRGASVGLVPHRIMPRSGGGREYREWSLTEWSITPLQANQDCLRMCLSRGYVTTKSLITSINTHLPTPVWANGYRPGEIMDLTTGRVRLEKSIFTKAADATAWLAANGYGANLTLADKGAAWVANYVDESIKTEAKKNLGSGVTAMLVKAMPDDEEDDDKKKPKKDDAGDKPDKPEKGKDDAPPDKESASDEAPSDDATDEAADETDEAPDEEAVDEGGESEDHTQKQGAKDLAVLMEHFETLINALPDILKRTDNDTVRKGVVKIQAEADKLMKHIGDVGQKAYPGLDLSSIKPSAAKAGDVAAAGDAPGDDDATQEVKDENGAMVGETAAPEPAEGDDGDDPFAEDEDEIMKALSAGLERFESRTKSLGV